MTRDEAITAEVRRVAEAAADRNNHLAHIRYAALQRLRGGDVWCDTAVEDDEFAGNRMFGEAA